MVPRQQNARLPLFLLLGLLGMVISLHAQPPNLTWAQWFEIQHINMAHPQCSDAMQVVNRYRMGMVNRRRMVCKDQNTFLRTTFAEVAHVCTTENVRCPTSRSMNCHNSSVQVPVTYCNLTRNARRYMDCRYTQTQAQRIYIIACNNRSPRDNATYPVVPVHLDAII
ncbi:non-secretory ribonuclease [Balaenoptera acutorostrata]|uniref:Non-secretory ribonuclease n=1 Tax=Balaenoptera acutorostrata TaxID=9767 RepID=A0A383ZZQ0_BALAC|nr:non-secretory ribonuclease [Balaenoptera acutorostrata]